jgi:putative transposase
VIAELLRTAADHGFAVIAYCVMPDHAHMLLEGVRVDADFRKFVAMFRQRSGYRFKRATGKSLWQDGYFERVLRSDEEYLPIAAYIFANPVRADLCASIGEYPFSGADRYSMKELMEWVQSSTSGSRP